ncbi:MAG: ATP-binding cassette domain-containing protein [Cyanobacteria bacterium SZAS LIN-3]|nr:ATP-binding cassette domain-containing protein [Cyanobacteria bacterium SZAS LIN-3]MBS2010904.1 ATP-binding cassette domain-containing protein [Cyanobacteria bacterium SZAS TMP-1]
MRERNEEPVLEVVNIHKAFGDRPILRGVSFQVYAGEMLGLIGPSGCGKSTLLKIICGLLEPDEGEVIKRSDDIGLVFQGSALLNSLSVRDNLAIALERKKYSRAKQDEVIREKLQLVGLRDFFDAFPTSLSGGQQKRTSFARAIVNDPRIILYDEPTTGLDPVMSTVIEDYMIELGQKLRPASIVVTHQYSTWSRTTDRVLLMHAGNIVWEGDPADGMTSDNPYMKQFAHATKEGPMLAGSV